MQRNSYVGIDGIQRTKESDEIISKNVSAVFDTPAGKEVLNYLRSITIESVNGPIIETNQLLHHEGQRYIVAIVENRIKHSKRIKTNG